MFTELSIPEYKILWVIGAAERLATLGMIQPNVPLQVSTEALNDYLEADEYRNILFENDFEVAQIFKCMATSESEDEIAPDDMNNLISLILAYKNDRENLVKYALTHAMA